LEAIKLIADAVILALPNVPLRSKQLLPEYSGIYYVLDEKHIVWYIGKAKNIYKRWQGKSHHRFYQLEAQKKKHFTIYYEPIIESQLDSIEKQRIVQYNPHLNSSPVKTKKVHPTETLLRETIVAIADFAFLVGIETPRPGVSSQISTSWRNISGLSVIHICLDLAAFKEKFKPESLEEQEALIKKAFSSRKAYANKWEGSFLYCLCVNGYLVKVSSWSSWNLKEEQLEFREYNRMTLAQEPIKALTSESLAKLQQISKQNQIDSSNEYEPLLNRLNPYITDLIKPIFNELIDRELIQQIYEKISEEYKAGKRGVGSRSRTREIKTTSIIPQLSCEFKTIEELLIAQGIDPQRYSIRSTTGNEILFKERERMGLYINCFTVNKDTPRQYMEYSNRQKTPCYNLAHGILNNASTSAASCQFNIVYLLVSVETKAWLLVEKYLQDFARPAIRQLTNGEGYTDKFYVSPRKSIIPAKVNIKIEAIGYSAWIPFGASEEFPTLELATKEIHKRLTDSGLPGLKFAFKQESITKLRLR
jgi:hypothetical protein